MARKVQYVGGMKTTRTATAIVPAEIVSVPGAGFFVVGKGGARHPLDRETFTSTAAARAALTAIRVASHRGAQCGV
jgi:hypothetical protein